MHTSPATQTHVRDAHARIHNMHKHTHMHICYICEHTHANKKCAHMLIQIQQPTFTIMRIKMLASAAYFLQPLLACVGSTTRKCESSYLKPKLILVCNSSFSHGKQQPQWSIFKNIKSKTICRKSES